MPIAVIQTGCSSLKPGDEVGNDPSRERDGSGEAATEDDSGSDADSSFRPPKEEAGLEAARNENNGNPVLNDGGSEAGSRATPDAERADAERDSAWDGDVPTNLGSGADADAAMDVADAGMDSGDGAAGDADAGDADAGDADVGDADAGDADANATGYPDAANPPPCDLEQPFGSPTPVDGINDGEHSVSGLRLTSDGNTAYFSRFLGDPFRDTIGWAIFEARRIAENRFEVGTELSGDYNATTPFPSSDGLALIYTKENGNGIRLFELRSETPSGPFAFPASPLPYPSGTVSAPYLANHDKRLYFNRPNGGVWHIWVTERDASSDPFAEGGLLVGNQVNVPGSTSSYPAVTGDELALYFATDRGSRDALGEFPKGRNDIMVATRSSLGAPFEAPRFVPELNSGLDELPTYVSPNGCDIYFTRYYSAVAFVFHAAKPR